MAELIGEGTYGCVHKPSLKCKTRKVNYHNKVSKIESTVEAIHEMKEYVLISRFDKNNHIHLGTPIKCEVDDTEYNVRSIRKCNNNDKFTNLNEQSLIIMENGGPNLEPYAKSLARVYPSRAHERRMHVFWIECKRVLNGIKTFLKHGAIHHDVKPQNIVYNEDNHRLNFIDFGLMTTMKKIIWDSARSKNWLSEQHWSFPFEMHYYNKNRFMDFVNGDKEQLQTFIYNIKRGSSDKSATAINTFFSFCIDDELSNRDYDSQIHMYLNDYYTFMMQLTRADYHNFISRSAATIDIYGAGIAFMNVLNKSKHLIAPKFAADLGELFYLMLTPNVNNRLQIDELIRRYNQLLQKHLK